jgi:hypothetical protein
MPAGPGGISRVPFRPQAERPHRRNSGHPNRTVGRRKANRTPTKTGRSTADRIAETTFCRKLLRARRHEDLASRYVTNSSLVKRPDGRFGTSQSPVANRGRVPVSAARRIHVC